MANTNLAELNALATKITGQTVAENSIVAALNKIASYYKGSSVAEISNAAALAEIEDNYSAGGGADIQANKAVTISTNTVTEVTPDDGKDGMAKVTVTTNIPPTDKTYTWYECNYLSDGSPSVDNYGVIAFFTDATMTNQVTLQDLNLTTDHKSDFHALFIGYHATVDYNFAVKHNLNSNSNFGQAIVAARTAELYTQNNDSIFAFSTEGGNWSIYEFSLTPTPIQKSLAWALSEYREIDDTDT